MNRNCFHQLIHYHNRCSSVQLPGLAEDFSDTRQIRWPNFLVGDILGYYVFPERRRIYKSTFFFYFLNVYSSLDCLDEAEREILTLAPHFEAKPTPESFNLKLNRLQTTAREDITWLHLLSKSSMRKNEAEYETSYRLSKCCGETY